MTTASRSVCPYFLEGIPERDITRASGNANFKTSYNFILRIHKPPYFDREVLPHWGLPEKIHFSPPPSESQTQTRTQTRQTASNKDIKHIQG